jgi:hypothetical protein
MSSSVLLSTLKFHFLSFFSHGWGTLFAFIAVHGRRLLFVCMDLSMALGLGAFDLFSNE